MLRALVPQDNSVCPNLRVPGYCLASNEKNIYFIRYF